MEETSYEFKNKIIETFKSFDSFCKKNKIKYFAAYGTLIGAVRHHGLIPWDDDIDVWMLPEDYERFCSYKGNVNGHYDIMDSRDEGYWLFSLAKYIDTNTTLWESECYPCVTGVYIDVFPLYEGAVKQDLIKKKEEYDRVSLLLTRSMMCHKWREFASLLFHRKWKEIGNYLSDRFYLPFVKQKIINDFNEVLKSIKSGKGNYLVSLEGPYRKGEVFNKEWFAGVQEEEFEDVTISIPAKYHDILSLIYGDYMKLPPKEKQVSHHAHYFLDLKHHWTIEDIKHKRYK